MSSESLLRTRQALDHTALPPNHSLLKIHGRSLVNQVAQREATLQDTLLTLHGKLLTVMEVRRFFIESYHCINVYC